MSILFPDGLPTTDRKGNEIYTDFRNMIRLESIFDDAEMTDAEKFFRALELLYGDEMPEDLTYEEAAQELHWFYGAGNDGSGDGTGTKGKRLYDFEEDGDCIYAAFLYAYGVDLVTADMHWWRFIALMTNVPKETLLAEKMYYRGVDTSKMKGQQKKETEKYKKLYALKKKTAPKKRLKSLKERLEARQEEIRREQHGV